MRLIILGSTGSIGTQTIEVIDAANRVAGRRVAHVVGIAAGRASAALNAQADRFPGCAVATAHSEGARPGWFHGPDAAERLVREVEADVVVAAIVGFAGLRPTLAAVELGRRVAIANKETLVAGGSLVVAAARESGAALLPIDSEHAGVWQCLGRSALPGSVCEHVSRVLLTASGGPFREWDRDRIARATAEQALKHPTWRMGPKNTIDSATLMNKSLELVEAHWLFGLPSSRIRALIHPQSVVHSFVEFKDGSVIAQCGSPDMRTPIQFALTYPRHVEGRAGEIDFASLSRLDFAAPDLERFPALAMGWRVIDEGGTSGAIFNAANPAGHPVRFDDDQSTFVQCAHSKNLPEFKKFQYVYLSKKSYEGKKIGESIRAMLAQRRAVTRGITIRVAHGTSVMAASMCCPKYSRSTKLLFSAPSTTRSKRRH